MNTQTRTITLMALCTLFLTTTLRASEGSSEPTRLNNVRVDDLDANYANITVTDCGAGACTGLPKIIKVSDSALKPELKSFKKGDHLVIDIDDKNELRSVGIHSAPVGLGLRLAVLSLAVLGVFIVAAAFARGHPSRWVIGRDNRYSNSQFQMAIWFWVLIATYIATVYLRTSYAGWEFLDHVKIPQNLLLLTGLSALTFGGAKGITSSKVKAAIDAGVNNPKHSVAAGQENFWNDLVQNDVGNFDLGDFQMILVTLLAVTMYLILVCHFLGSIEFRNAVDLPDVDTTILAAFGLGQGAYLTKKAAGDVGAS